MILDSVIDIFYVYKYKLNYFKNSVKSELYNAYSDDSDVMNLFDDWNSELSELEIDCKLVNLFNCDEDINNFIYDSLEWLLDDTKDDEDVYIEGYTDDSEIEYNFYVYRKNGPFGPGYYGYDMVVDIISDIKYINTYFKKLEELFKILKNTMNSYCDDIVKEDFEELVGYSGYYC